MIIESHVHMKLNKEAEGQKFHDAAVLLHEIIQIMSNLHDPVKLECVDDYHGDWCEYMPDQLINAYQVLNSIAECYDNLEIVPKGCEYSGE